MIESSKKVLLDAIKSSLFGIPFSYPDDTDWNVVIKEAKSQTVLGLISSVIPVHDESSDQGKAYYMRLLHEQDKLIKLLDENNIPCVILKGCAAAVYYPKPYLRSMGDVDFLVRREQFNSAMNLMESNGYVCIEGKDENGQIIQGVRHLGYQKNGIEFELHHHFSSSGFDIDDILEKAIDNREYRELNGYRFPILPEVENGLVLLGHINQHITYDNLGLRQIIDWEMYFNSVISEEWESKFEPIAKKAGLWRFAVNITRMCGKHLGLAKTLMHTKNMKYDISDELLDYFITSGNFGIKQSTTSSDVKSVDTAHNAISIIKRKGLFSYFQANGIENWRLCQKYPSLKKFAFIYGVLRFFIRGILYIIQSGKNKMKKFQ